MASGTLLVGALWALGAVVLPALVRGRHSGADLVVAAAWAGALAVGTGAIAGWLGGPEPAGLVPAVLAGGALAVAGARVGPAGSGHTWSVHVQGSSGARRGESP